MSDIEWIDASYLANGKILFFWQFDDKVLLLST